MLKLVLEEKITSLWEAEQHVYGIPDAGSMPSPDWLVLSTERRVRLRGQAIGIWKRYLENDFTIVPHPPIAIPEYREMLTNPDGDMIVEEA
jgi:hypothetical protein